MRYKNLFVLFIAALLVFSCQDSNKKSDNNKSSDTTAMISGTKKSDKTTAAKALTVKMEATSGSNLSGNATFTEANGEVTMKVKIHGLSQGEHAIHIHEKGDCSAEDGTSAGGHWNPTNERHGKWGDAEGYHKGDIGNLEVSATGVGEMEFTTEEWCIGCNDMNKDIIGKALIIHAGVDDFTSQPAGDAGARVGCGVIE